MKRNGYKSSETKDRLLEAGGEIFAEQGFRNARVREICKRAGANLAAVNYHFGDKEGLYSAVFKYSHGCAIQDDPRMPSKEDGETPEGRLRTFVRSFLFRIFDEGRPAWHGKLIAREMTEPTKALDNLIKDHIRPLHLRLHSIVKVLLNNRSGEANVRLCSLSIVGQCLYYYYCRALVLRLFPEQKYTPEAIEKISDHIINFSLDALKGNQKRGLKRR